MLMRVLSACAFAVLANAMSSTAHAQGSADYRTVFTFSQPVTLPGVTLPAGTYLFRLPETTGSRRVVQVLSHDGKQSYAMLLAIPAQRLEASSKPEVRFMETSADTPRAIKTWWYPGDSTGWEFIYPKDQALRLAKGASQPVLTTMQAANATTEEMKTTDLSRVSSSGQQASVTPEAKPAAVAPSGTTHEGQIASSTLDVPASPTPVAANSAAISTGGTTGVDKNDAKTVALNARTSLPRTASLQPAVLLMGALSLCAGIGLSLWPRLRV